MLKIYISIYYEHDKCGNYTLYIKDSQHLVPNIPMPLHNADLLEIKVTCWSLLLTSPSVYKTDQLISKWIAGL